MLKDGEISAKVSWGREPTRRRLATAEALCRASYCEVWCVEKIFWI